MLVILAGIMHFNGKFDESIALVKNAMRLCPYYPAFYLRVLSISYFLTGLLSNCRVLMSLSFPFWSCSEFQAS
jgi:hypothetical protein